MSLGLKNQKHKMEIIIGIIAFVIGGGTGAGVASYLVKKNPPETKIIEKMVEVDNSLSSTDLLKIPCSLEYMEKNGESLCREMFCRMNTRSGNQSNSASAKECEAISNVLNKLLIKTECAKEETPEAKRSCVEFFDRRI